MQDAEASKPFTSIHLLNRFHHGGLSGQSLSITGNLRCRFASLCPNYNDPLVIRKGCSPVRQQRLGLHEYVRT